MKSTITASVSHFVRRFSKSVKQNDQYCAIEGKNASVLVIFFPVDLKMTNEEADPLSAGFADPLKIKDVFFSQLGRVDLCRKDVSDLHVVIDFQRLGDDVRTV